MGGKKGILKYKGIENVTNNSTPDPEHFFFICPFSLSDLDHYVNNLCYCHSLE